VPFHFLHFQGRAKDLMAKFAWPVTESFGHYSLGMCMEDIDMGTDIESENAMLRRRIAALEHDVRNLREMVTPLLRHSWRAKFTPKLWQWVQYDPREVVELTAVVAETPLPSPAPRISIVTPSYNYAEFLGATVMSVITQSYPNLTYVVQDNNSTDGTAKLLAEIAHRGLMQEPRRLIVRGEADRGQADAINRGFAQAPDAEIMGYLNADDILLPGTLSFVANAFQRYPHIDVVYGHRIFIDADGWETGRCVLPNHDRDIIRWMDYIPQETMFWRRRVWDRVGPLDESFQFAIDWDFILRADDAGFRFKRLPRFLGCFRWHDRQKTSALLKVGADEQKRLRRRHLGYEPKGKEIGRKTKGYLRRHVLFHRAYKLRLLGI
jgi:glycosyltransferase involved in cell wall biosynthesis